VTLPQFFIVAVMDMYQRTRGQVLVFKGEKYILGGKMLFML